MAASAYGKGSEYFPLAHGTRGRIHPGTEDRPPYAARRGNEKGAKEAFTWLVGAGVLLIMPVLRGEREICLCFPRALLYSLCNGQGLLFSSLLEVGQK